MSDDRNISRDPLDYLPPEIVLRILDFSPVSAVAALTCASKSWHAFIDEAHQDHIYSDAAKTNRGTLSRGDSVLRHHHGAQNFTHYYEKAHSWKDLCRRQTLLRRNWDARTPVTTESIFSINKEPVWRFRPDFRRRFFISTSQFGGLEVTCMDTGRRLWSLSHDEVRPYAHLEYDEVNGRGMAVWDRDGDAVEVWQTTEEAGGEKGVFEQVAVLDHDCETRGYQLSYDTLCVVSSQGKGYIYNMQERPPKLRCLVELENNAVGHLYQDEEYVLYSLGTKGYHIHSVKTGQYMGAIEPRKCSPDMFYHIAHPGYIGRHQDSLALASALQSMQGNPGPVFPPRTPTDGRLLPFTVEPGPNMSDRAQGQAAAEEGQRSALRDDDWGAGMISGNIMVGLSRGGRVIVVRNWRECLSHAPGNTKERAAAAFSRNTSLIICPPPDDPRNFDLGGWLSIRNGRVLFEVKDLVYILALNPDGTLPTATGGATPDRTDKGINEGQEQRTLRPSYAMCKCATSSLGTAVPVSFMALFDDSVMYTYTVLGVHEEGAENIPGNPYSRLFLTKAVRVLSFAPVEADGDSATASAGGESADDADPGLRFRHDEPDGYLSRFFRQLVASAARSADDADSTGDVDDTEEDQEHEG